MAIDWGAWDYGGGNGMRVGIEVTWEAISHSEAAATATIKIYTDTQYNYSADSQTLTYSGSISGSTSFSNSQSSGGGAVLRATKTYTYNYGSSEYGSSPGTRTFTAKLSGAYNGVTPSNSVTSSIPKRPYAAPAAPTNVNTSRISDTSIKTTWTNKDTAGEPWDSIDVQRDDGANDVWNSIVGTPGGGATSFTDSTTGANYAYRYRVRSSNSIGDSGWVEGDLIYTTPAAPTIGSRTPGTGAQQVVTWTNRASSYMVFQTEVWVSRDGGATWSLLTTQGSSVTSFTDTAASAAQKTGYKVRHKTAGGAQGTLYSAYSATTDFTVGTVSAPNAPTVLAPDGNLIISPSQAKTFTWNFNTTDTTDQTAYQIQYRVVGSGSWTVLSKTASAVKSWMAAASTFNDSTSYEWQVRTWATATTGGSDGTGASAWSASATFKTVGDPNAARELKRVVRLDLETGREETAPVNSLPPIGSLMMFAGSVAPSGWLMCQGQSLLRSDYPDLFGVIGTAYGSVDSTHFTLPNFTDRGPVGQSGTKPLGSTGGSGTVTLAVANLPSHTHSFSATTSSDSHSHTFSMQYTSDSTNTGARPIVRDIANKTGGGGTSATISTSSDAHSHTVSGTTGAAGSGSAFSTQDPYVAVNFIIRT